MDELKTEQQLYKELRERLHIEFVQALLLSDEPKPLIGIVIEQANLLTTDQKQEEGEV